MHVRDRARILKEEAFRINLPLVGVGVALGAATVATDHLWLLLGIPGFRAAWLCLDFTNARRLRAIESRKHRALFRARRKQFVRERRRIRLPGEDAGRLSRIDHTVEDIQRHIELADELCQPSLRPLLARVQDQAAQALGAAARLSSLLLFLSRDDPARLSRELDDARAALDARSTGLIGDLLSQTYRFRQQQMDYWRMAADNAALFRAQIQTIEAGLATVQARVAGLSTLEFTDALEELRILDEELSVLDEGMQRVAGIYRGDPMPPPRATGPTRRATQTLDPGG